MGCRPLRVDVIRRGARRTGLSRPATPISSSSRSPIARPRVGQPLGNGLPLRLPDARLAGPFERTRSMPSDTGWASPSIGFSSRSASALITWRSVGLDIPIHESRLPSVIQRGEGVPLPGAAAVSHRDGPATLKLLSVAADQERLAGWLGDHDLPIAVTGPSETSAITLTRGQGDFTLE